VTHAALSPPETPLADGDLRLEPLGSRHGADLDALANDPDVRRFTYVPLEPPAGFGTRWAARYDEGWRDGTRAGFAIRDGDDERGFLGFVAFVQLDRDARQGEIGYVVAPAGRGRGVATRALRLLTRWGFEELGLERVELRIDVVNTASEIVAARAGYVRDGVLRSSYFKEGLRVDLGVWSRLATDA
jgi:RimJ/RimL family protein N-acetyltransferase